MALTNESVTLSFQKGKNQGISSFHLPIAFKQETKIDLYNPLNHDIGFFAVKIISQSSSKLTLR